MDDDDADDGRPGWRLENPDEPMVPNELPTLIDSFALELSKRAHPSGNGYKPGPIDGDPLDLMALALLVDEHGAHNPHMTERDGKQVISVTRPGKVNGTSATIGYVGPGVISVWSSSWEGIPIGHWDIDHVKAKRFPTVEKWLEKVAIAKDAASSWLPVADLADRLRNHVGIAEPDVGMRLDGVHLFYRQRLNVIGGEPEAGKSWLALLAAAQELRKGNAVCLIDFEDTEHTMAARFAELSIDAIECVESNLLYFIRPEDRPSKNEIDALTRWVLTATPTLIVVDSANEALSMVGADINDNTAVITFYRLLRNLADYGPAVVLIDHVAKNPDNRRGFTVGAGSKKAALNGAQFELRKNEPFAPGQAGSSWLSVTKDRPGGVRRYATPKGLIGLFKLQPDITNDCLSAFIEAVSEEDAKQFDIGADCAWSILLQLQAADALGGMSKRELAQSISSKLRPALIGQLARLVSEGAIVAWQDGRTTMFRLVPLAPDAPEHA